MYQRILVPLDGSARAERAVPVAARISAAHGGSVVLLRVIELPPASRPHMPGSYEPGPPVPPCAAWTPEAVDVSQNRAAKYLASVATQHGRPNVDMQGEVVVISGSPAAAILAATHAQHADLIVLCRRGHAGRRRWPLGSVAQKIVHHASVPVLLLPEHSLALAHPHRRPRGPLRALVPLDGSELAEAALVPAASVVTALAAPGRAVMHLVRVLDMRDITCASGSWSRDELSTSDARDWSLREGKAYLSALADQVERGPPADPQLVVTWSAVFPNPLGSYEADVAEAILRTAEVGEDAEGAAPASRCDLIAMATHGQGGWERWTMGSITERVLHATRLPALIVRPHEMATEEEWTRPPITNAHQER